MFINIYDLIKYSQKPELFAKGEKLFWNDPHIAKNMLMSHLSQNNDLASYKLEKVQKIVDFSCSELNLKAGNSVLDCGCGPGLYCERFYKKGLKVTGIDISLNSIEYAKKSANSKKMNINYICQSYLDMIYENDFDAVFIIWQDFCVLNNSERKKFLNNIYRALKPKGYFVLDVSTPKAEEELSEKSTWTAQASGFWSPNPHVVLENLFFYNNKHTRLNQYVVIEEDKERVFRIYHQNYTLNEIKQLLAGHNFKIIKQYADLTGKKLKDDSSTIGVIAQKII